MFSVDDVLAHESPLSLDPEFESACPCAEIKGDGFRVEVHCWRVYANDGCSCQWSGVHVTGLPAAMSAKVANHVASHNGWSGHTTYHGDVTTPDDEQDEWEPS